ncbi:MAG: GNAT family N-acetyltransferase [Candidatus Zixiibacteriota bacterium]|nr:MAG: GNAT family N-acetyltransferase [candidate division Zixibacteria bacterium]
MNKNALNIRPAASADYHAIATLLDRVLGKVQFEKRLKLWQWRNDSNPARIPEIPGFLVAERNGQIVGIHGLTPMRVKIGEHQFHAACSCDFAVNPTARSVGMKLKLKTLERDVSPLPISTSANEPANRITLALGGKELLTGRKRFINPLKASGFVRKAILNKIGLSAKFIIGICCVMFGKPLDSVLALIRKLKSYPNVTDSRILDIDRFDQRFDSLYEKISRRHPIMTVRDSSYLNWRYTDYPFKGIQSFALLRIDELLGFAVIHDAVDDFGLRFFAILELLAPVGENAVFENLLGEIIRRAENENADYIIAITSTAEWEKIFKKYGFRIRNSHFSTTTYKNNTDLPDELFSMESNWYVSLGDGDICYYY